MSSTAASASHTASAQTSQTTQANRAGPSGGPRATEPGADNSLFANLLSLLGDTHGQPLPALAAEGETGAGEGDALLATEDAPDDNPLAALAGWPGSPVAADATGSQGAQPGATGRVEGAQGTDASEWTAADETIAEVPGETPGTDAAADRAAHESPQDPPATALRGQAALKGLSATAQAQMPAARSAAASAASASAAVPAPAWAAQGSDMVWRRTGGASTESLQQAGAAHLAGMRSTVTLNERFGNLAAGGEFGAVALREAGGAAQASGQGSGVPGGGPGASLSVGEAGAAGTASGDHADDAHTGEQDGQGSDASDAAAETEAEGNQISHWGTQNLRHASLRVGQAGEDAIDIQLSVKGQEAQIDFRTDNAEARASLENSADESLSELLQRSGIQLAGVSVGSQGQASGRNASSGDPGAPRAARSPSAVAGAAEQQPTMPRSAPLRADGSRPLDLFV